MIIKGFIIKGFIVGFLSLFSNAISECTIKYNTTDRRISNNTIKIVQYNVEWLFLDYCDTSKCPGSGCTWQNTSESLVHLEYVANIINIMNPDIINLCEVEGCTELNTLIQHIDSKTYNPYLIKGTDSTTGQNVGMITRLNPLSELKRIENRVEYPINGSTCGYVGEHSTTGVSKHYFTEFNWYDHNILFVSIHLLAYPDDISRCVQREAQAQVIQQLVFNYYTQGYEIIVMGDFNDFDSDFSDLNNNKPISQVLNIIKGNFGEYKGLYQLINVGQQIQQSNRFSDWWDKDENCISSEDEFSLIDHILVTPFLQEKIINVSIFHEYPEFCGKYNSDHYPYIIELDGNI
jgi:exonuclease III